MSSLLLILNSYICHGDLHRATKTFSLILRSSADLPPDTVSRSLSSLLHPCSFSGLVYLGEQLHSFILSSGLLSHPSLVSRLVAFYSDHAILPSALRIAEDHSDDSDPLPWNILLSANLRLGLPRATLYLSTRIISSPSLLPDAFTFAPLIKAVGQLSDLRLARAAHRAALLFPAGHSLFVLNALISMYGKFGHVSSAREVFERMPLHDQVSWNSIISIYASRGLFRPALDLFRRMPAEHRHVIIWNTVASVCVRVGEFSSGLNVLSEMAVSGLRPDPVAMINGLNASSRGRFRKAGEEIHCAVVRVGYDGATNVCNALICMYFSHGRISCGEAVFRRTGSRDVVTWNSAISGYVWAGMVESAYHLLRKMVLHRDGAHPNHVTMATLISVAVHRYGRELHGHVVRSGSEYFDRIPVWNALVEMYGRSGRVTEARRVFDSVTAKDEVTYTCMISAYGMKGDGSAAVALLQEMETAGVPPDAVTLVAVLSACSHSGMVEVGERVFRGMKAAYGVSPEFKHFACLADMYGRAGLLEKAAETIARMPFRATASVWATLLAACVVHRNDDVGEWAVGKLLEAKPEMRGHYVLAANMYAYGRRWEELSRVRKLMRDLGIGRSPGRSWVAADGGYVSFSPGDTDNPLSSGIYDMLYWLNKGMRDECVVFRDDDICF